MGKAPLLLLSFTHLLPLLPPPLLLHPLPWICPVSGVTLISSSLPEPGVELVFKRNRRQVRFSLLVKQKPIHAHLLKYAASLPLLFVPRLKSPPLFDFGRW
jgi:hypothetical protein